MSINFTQDILIALMAGSAALFIVAVVLGAIKVMRADIAEGDLKNRLSMLPAISQLQAAEAQLVHKNNDLNELEASVADLRQEQAEIQRHAVDAQHWQQQAEQAKRDYENLDDKVAKIDEIRDQYQEAAHDLADIQKDVNELVRQRNILGDEIGDIEKRRDEATQLNVEIEELSNQLKDLKNSIAEQKDLREEMMQARFELDQLVRRKAELEHDLNSLPDQVAVLKEQKNEIEQQVAELNNQRATLHDIEDRISHLTAREQALEESIERLKAKRDGLFSEAEGLLISGGDSDKGLTKEQADLAVQDLWSKPSCLFDNGVPLLKEAAPFGSEQEALEHVEEYLIGHGLQFDSSLIKRFHTSLKIGRVSPLTVLAGISGTGKSLLPQRYAEAMGIPFLKAAVQPRWDSPQDLLGFYNYLEKNYKATDLARALAYVDTNSENKSNLEPMDDRLLMVLLDEMNLARIEFYFSEFLSRLENRPEPGVMDVDAIRASRIEIDVPTIEGHSISIYPGHNTLFVGTMNEDESTQALTDKVLDRGNALRFGEPREFVKKHNGAPPERSRGFLPFEDWREWYRPDLEGSKKERLDENVRQLNKHLAVMGRPFGHRIYHAIYAYVSNHPDVDNAGSEDKTLAEMMRMRVFPKLRGIELRTDEERALNEIISLVGEELEDEELASDIRNSIGEDNMFTWKG